MDTLLLIDKPAGITSHDVVDRVRKIFHTRAVGHAGTLDPFATGLLILGVNKATKQLTALVGLDKTYIATAKLGFTSTTDDPEGTITEYVGAQFIAPGQQNGPSSDLGVMNHAPTRAEIETALHSFLGISEQITPLYSAKKVGGKKMYELARKGLGDTVERPKKIITIHDIKLLSLNGDEVTFEVSCGSGTYIRAIARDLGEKLGCGAYLTALRRTKIGDKNIEDAKTLEELATLFPQSSSIDHDSGKS